MDFGIWYIPWTFSNLINPRLADWKNKEYDAIQHLRTGKELEWWDIPEETLMWRKPWNKYERKIANTGEFFMLIIQVLMGDW